MNVHLNDSTYIINNDDLKYQINEILNLGTILLNDNFLQTFNQKKKEYRLKNNEFVKYIIKKEALKNELNDIENEIGKVLKELIQKFETDLNNRLSVLQQNNIIS